MSIKQINHFNIGLFQYNAIAWTVIILFTVASVFSSSAGEADVATFFLFFAALGVLMLSIANHIRLDENSISVYSLFSGYRIDWKDIKLIEVGVSMFVCHGEGEKRLIVPLFFMWSGKEKNSACELVDKKISDFKIDSVESFTADYKIHKNVKIKNT